MDIDEFKKFLAETFGTGQENKISEASQKKIDAIVGWVEDNTYDIVDTVAVVGARVQTETVEAYGLEITVDANGRAVHVTTPDGFHLDGAR